MYAEAASAAMTHLTYPEALVVGLHVATAIAMIAYFWWDWLRIIAGFFSSIRAGDPGRRRVEGAGPLGAGIQGQILAGSILSGVGAYLALRYFVRYLASADRTLVPFAVYCLAVGIGSAAYLAVR